MASGSQKFIARNRAPRVQIEYDVELYGSEKKVQLPFVMGVMADLAGKSAVAQPAIADRRFLEIDVDNFDERMRAMAPRASFAVPNTLTGEGNLSVDLTFESMNDFTPGAVAARIGPLRALLEARTQLSNLLTYMDGKTGAEELIERLLGDPALLAAVVSAPAPAPAGDGEETGVLDALRTAAPDAAPAGDGSADVLAALRASAPEPGAEDRTADDALAGLRAAAPAEAAEDTTTEDTLAGLRHLQPRAAEETDPSADILAGLAATPEVAAAPDTTDALLAGLAAGADEAAAEADDTDAILGDLATTPEAEADADPSADILAGLAGLAEAEAGSDLDALLAGDDGDAALDALLGAIPDATGPDATGPDAAVPGGAGSDLDALLADDDGDAALNALLAAGGEDAGGAPDEPAGSDPAGTDTNTDAALAALLGGNDGDAGLDALLGAVDDAPGSDLDALLTGDDDLDALLAGTLDGDTAIGGDDGASLSDAPDGAGDTDLDALLAGDDDAGLDALLGAIGSDEDMPAPAAEGEANETEDEMSAIPGDGAGDERKVDQPFGFISAPRPAPEDLRRTGFRMAIFGDFTGRAARGLIETGDALAARRAIPLDVDTVEEVIEGFATDLVLPVGPDGAGIRVSLKELDALHPDELFDNVEIFAGISGLRQRLKSASLAPAALDQLRKWGEAHGQRLAPPRRKSAGSSVPANLKLGAFQQLIGDSGGRLTQASPIDDMVARIIGPHVVEAPNPDAAAMLTAVDDALSSAMRLILHHPEFQSVEALWRSLDFLARRIETDTKLTIDLYDVSAEELAVDLAAGDDLSESGLLKLLADRPLGEEGPGGYSALFGLYTFEETPPHAELLARVAQVAAHVDAPFFTAISPGFLDVAKEDRHPLVAKAWDTLRGLPEAAYLGIASPRFLLRRPYGQRTEPVDAFDFEEFTESEGLSGMLWANPVLLVAVLLGAGWSKHGKEMSLGSVMSINDIPFHFVRDRHGDQVALPHTERNLTTSKVRDVVTRGFQPVLSIRGRDEIRLGSFQSLAGEEIRGRWTGVPMPPKAPPPVTPAAAARPADIEMEIAAPGDDGGADLDALLAGLGSDAGEGEGGDADLDALLAGLGGADDTGGDDADLDALLAGFDDAGTGPSDDGGMDPELAALLEGL
ncbi:MAG: type VI secretion system contractile sheath small subunit [Defluviimonas sp.]|nr:type VI secretion system contractile sheath small subunit [Defluviimonas sp.]